MNFWLNRIVICQNETCKRTNVVTPVDFEVRELEETVTKRSIKWSTRNLKCTPKFKDSERENKKKIIYAKISNHLRAFFTKFMGLCSKPCSITDSKL